MTHDAPLQGPDFEPPDGHVPGWRRDTAPQRPQGSSDAVPPAPPAAGPTGPSSVSGYEPPTASHTQFRGAQQPTYSPGVDWAPPSVNDLVVPTPERPQVVRRRRAPRSSAVATWSLIGICVVVWLLQWAVPGFFEAVVLAPAYGAVEPWRFLTSAFAHSYNITHILFNMYALWVLGVSLEGFMGRARFLATYLLSALGGGVAYVLMASPPVPGLPGDLGANWYTGVVGASGAVFGLFGALLVLQRFLGQSSRQLVLILLINAVIGFVVPGIAWQAHLGGFLVGIGCAVAVLRGAGDQAGGGHDRTWWYLAGIGVLLVAVTVVKYAIAG